jgi:nucleoid DNA-binding protein
VASSRESKDFVARLAALRGVAEAESRRLLESVLASLLQVLKRTHVVALARLGEFRIPQGRFETPVSGEPTARNSMASVVFVREEREPWTPPCTSTPLPGISADVVDAFVAAMNAAIDEDGWVTVPGLGTLLSNPASPFRLANDPRTGEEVAIPSRGSILFTPAREMLALGDEVGSGRASPRRDPDGRAELLHAVDPDFPNRVIDHLKARDYSCASELMACFPTEGYSAIAKRVELPLRDLERLHVQELLDSKQGRRAGAKEVVYRAILDARNPERKLPPFFTKEQASQAARRPQVFGPQFRPVFGERLRREFADELHEALDNGWVPESKDDPLLDDLIRRHIPGL